MGSAGHAFISHTKALSPVAQVKDGGHGSPPHPLAARPGQRYWPRSGRRKRPFVVKRVEAAHVIGARLDGGETVRVSLARLLEPREDGLGQHYQFNGFASRRYNTYACVWKLEERAVLLCVPEWHPGRTVHLPASLVPEPALVEGAWLSLRCDLSAPSAARLQPSHLEPAADPGPDVAVRPQLG